MHSEYLLSGQFLLCTTEQGLGLQDLRGKQKNKPIYVDFLSGTAMHRRKYGGGFGQLLARAVGIKPNKQLTIIDATAGLGRDAFVLATLGCTVQLLERSPIIAALLEDGLKRARLDPAFADIKMSLVVTDAISYLNELNSKQRPDVVYLDPMYPASNKSALAKKEMRILRSLVGDDLDADRLLAVALQIAKKRVVVKRPRLAPPIPGAKPDLIFTGKSSRFDVYFTIPHK